MSFCLYNKKNITQRLEDMNFIFLWQKQYFTLLLRSFVKYCFATPKKKFISSSHRVISSIYRKLNLCTLMCKYMPFFVRCIHSLKKCQLDTKSVANKRKSLQHLSAFSYNTRHHPLCSSLVFF